MLRVLFAFLLLGISKVFPESALDQLQFMWRCPLIDMTFERAKQFSGNYEYGHYEQSCLRLDSVKGQYVFCKTEHFCGVDLILDADYSLPLSK